MANELAGKLREALLDTAVRTLGPMCACRGPVGCVSCRAAAEAVTDVILPIVEDHAREAVDRTVKWMHAQGPTNPEQFGPLVWAIAITPPNPDEATRQRIAKKGE